MKITNKKLSFIIPVYNVENYLSECVDSILLQANEECEIVLINDGSMDLSGDICDEYEKKNNIVKVIHQENEGVSYARNQGLLAASGEYVIFIDSDDRITNNSVDKILNWINDNDKDLCFLQFIKFYPNGKKEKMRENIEKDYLCGKSKEAVMEYLASRPKYPGSACGKIFKRNFLVSNNLFFPSDKRFCEDLGFMRDCILLADSFDTLDFWFYEYRQNREESRTNIISEKHFKDLAKFIEESIEKLTIDKEAINQISKYAMSFVAYEYSILLLIYNSLPDVSKANAVKILKKYKWTLKYARSKKIKLVHITCSCIGIRLTILLMYVCRKIKAIL